MSKKQNYLQPAIAVIDSKSAVALHRYIGTGDKKTGFSRTDSGGKSWTQVRPLKLPNPNSSLAVSTTSDGNLLAILNPTDRGRNRLSLAFSKDKGETWKIVYDLENSARRSDRFSYPNIIKTTTGDYHVVYTYKRKNIAHIRFNEAWLNNKTRGN